jgi:electron transport complex protein RnfE
MVILGAAREITSAGTLFSHASVLLGEGFSFMETVIIPDYKGFLLTALPPGGFIVLGFLVAVKRLLDKKVKTAAAQPVMETIAEPATSGGEL